MPRGIGNMTEQLVIRRNTPVDDGEGGTTPAWSTLDSIDAEYVPLIRSVREQLQAEHMTAQFDAHFRTRARADITTKMQAYWTPAWPPSSPRQIFEIHGVTPDPDDAEFMYLIVGSTEDDE